MQAKKYLVLFAALLMNATGVYAQYNPYWQWAKADTVNTLPVSNGSSVLAVKNGKALWGHMTAVKRSAGGEPEGNYNVTEYDSTGRALNVTLIVGKVQLFDAQADAAGNWYVLGRFYDTLLFSGGTQLIRNNPPTNPDADHFMVKFNAGSMAIAWVKLVGPFTTVTARTFTLDNNSIYIAVDSFNNTVIRSMSFATGDAISLFTQHGPSNTTSIQVDAKGSYYLAGTCSRDGIDFNGVSEVATTPVSYTYIVKYRSNGTHVWHQWMRDDHCLTRKLTLYNNSFLFYTGSLQDSFTIGGKQMHQSFNGSDYIAARLDTSGNLIWARQLDTAGANALVSPGEPYHAVVTPDTALVMFAEGSGYIYWGDSTETDLLSATAATLAAIGPNNKMRWVRPIYTDYTTNQHVATEGIAVWVTGNAFSQTGYVMLDTLRLRVPARKFVPYLAKTKLVRPIPVNPPPAGVAGAAAEHVSVYPVPVHTTLRVEGLQGACTLTLSDVSGRAVRRIITAAGTTGTLMDVADLPRGAYILDMQGDGSRVIRKVVLQ